MSLADLIVLGGCAAVEQAAKNAGHDVQVPFSPGRTDASAEQTDVDAFAVLEPTADGFRNYFRAGDKRRPEELLIDRSSLLALTAPEMTVLDRRPARPRREHRPRRARRLHRPARDADQRLLREPARHGHRVACVLDRARLRGPRPRHRDRSSGPATAVDLIFGSNSQLRAIAEVYACDDAEQKFVRDFVAAWDKVMNLDRFDLP